MIRSFNNSSAPLVVLVSLLTAIVTPSNFIADFRRDFSTMEVIGEHIDIGRFPCSNRSCDGYS
jgi:hypothetical protein